ncbi:MAG: cytochrome C oxidase subunit IV family protein [Acidimicrobiia bacterium]
MNTENPETPDETADPEVAEGGGAVATLTESAVAAPEVAHVVPHEGHETELEPFGYVMVALGLCVLTALEVGLWYLEGHWPNWLIVSLLLVLAIAKLVTVAGWYMHLSGDAPIFRRYFMIGGIGAFTLFTIVWLTLRTAVIK